MMTNDEELIRSLAPLVPATSPFLPDERDLLARIERARQPSRFGGLAAALSGAALALGFALAMPRSQATLEVPALEDEVIESFGSALTGENLMSWDEWIVPDSESPAPRGAGAWEDEV